MMLTVGKKITGGFLLVILLVVIMSVFTYVKIGDINSSYEVLIDNSLRKMELTQGVATDLANEAVAMRRFNFTGNMADIAAFNDYRKKSDEKLAQLSEIVITEQGRKTLQVMRQEKANYEAIAEKSIEARKANNQEAVGLYMQEVGKPYNAAINASEELVQVVKALVDTDKKAQTEQAKQAQTLLLLVNIFVAFIAVGIGVFVSQSISKPIRKITGCANELANGNLREEDVLVKSSDEIGQLAVSFNTMKENLRQLIKQVMVTAEQVAASSEELTASSEQSAQAANQVASSITNVANQAGEQLATANETAAVVEQMSAGIQQVAANANQVAAHSAQAADKAKTGGTAVEQAVTQMNTIEKSSQVVAGTILNLNEKSREIGQIVDTIAGIAGQTNLLALNAAIEAARAGEQGRGFAVVAEEIRKLAEDSQAAAKQIAQLIGEIQGDTGKAVAAMNDGAQEVKTGTEVVSAAGTAFRDIAELVTQVSGQVKEISAAIQQMAGGSQQIVGSVKKIDDLSKAAAGETQTVSAAAEEQLASMEEIAGSSEALSQLSQELQATVAKFHV